ncbi:hypothetical protein CAL25_06520 [Bordetella genomosp. 5]|uniref:HTH gntR-type domain-containing protein n=2 Tax=Bordetella genomosp. 5 TaxID=1395608 RepID=A0A261TWT6_9BORD|nr:hypothetical protein CAL25_06520 [Bordetella genomosp. 5]
MSESQLFPLPKQHMFDRVYEHMLDLISSGQIKPGERIKDGEWATKLGVSRTPVREAIRKLNQDGLLIALPTGGYQIRRLSHQEIGALYRCRAALESAAVREVAKSGKQPVFEALKKVVDDTDKAIEQADLSRGFELNTQFHHMILEACENEFIKDMLGSLQRMIKFYRGNALAKAQASAEDAEIYLERLKIKQAHHRAIYNAVSSGKEELAAKLMNDHVTATVEDLAGSVEQPLLESKRA